MYPPQPAREIPTLAGYIDQQLAAVRAATLGLTETQARQTPCRSMLSIGGILKHVTYGLHHWVADLTSDPAVPRALDAAAFAAHQASFSLTDSETVADVIADFDVVRAELGHVLAAADPEQATLEPAAPWSGIFEARPARRRYLLVHIVEELARHAGHADIIREQLDGTSVPTLVLTEEGAPPSDFFTPYVADPGTIGA